MALTVSHRCWRFCVALLCLATCCSSDQAPADAVAKALICFSNHYVYSSCQESYRLNAQGSINVPSQAVDEYCNGPCLAETNLVLHCVNNILHNFIFSNGASVQDVRYTLDRGCGHSPYRGDFNVLDHLGGYPDACGEGYGDIPGGYAGQQPGGFQNPNNGGGFQNPNGFGFQNPNNGGGFQNPNGFGSQNPDEFGVFCDEGSKLAIPTYLLVMLSVLIFWAYT